VWVTATPAPPCGDRFHCNSGECIDYEIVCNGNPDCIDASDEPRHCRKYQRSAVAKLLHLRVPRPSLIPSRRFPSIILLFLLFTWSNPFENQLEVWGSPNSQSEDLRQSCMQHKFIFGVFLATKTLTVTKVTGIYDWIAGSGWSGAGSQPRGARLLGLLQDNNSLCVIYLLQPTGSQSSLPHKTVELTKITRKITDERKKCEKHSSS